MQINFESFSTLSKLNVNLYIIVKVIRDIAESMSLEEGKNLILNKYVTEVHYEEPGDFPVKVVARDTKTGKKTIFRAKWTIMTFRKDYCCCFTFS